MLQAIREKAQGWIAWAIVILISIPFALWGIQEYLGVGSEPRVAVIDGEDITQRMLDQRARDFRQNLRASRGDAYRADLFEDAVLKARVREAMIEERVLAKFAREWNLRTADGQTVGFIASIPSFQRDGRFDQQLYEAAVRNRGMSTAGFEQTVRHDLAVGQLRAGIRDSAFITDRTLSDHVRLSDQTRTVRYARIPAESFRDGVGVDADAVRAFYDANPERYRKQERLRLAYLVLNAEELTQYVEVDEARLREYFDAHRAEFIAREEREMRHILVAVPQVDDGAALTTAQDKASGLLARMQAGADFAELARTESDDPGSAANGGDLGWVERGMMVPPFEEAAFELEKLAISDLVRTDFGFHIIQVTDIRGGSDADFEEVRDEVDAAYRRFEAENLYFDYAERLAEAAYENAASLTPAAEALGLTIQESDWMTREGLPTGLLGSPRVVNAAFSEDVLVDGNNSDLIEVAGQQAVVLRVLEHDPAGVRPFDDNRAAIEADYVATQAAAAAARAGAEVLQRLEANEGDLEAVAAEHGQSVEGPTTTTRRQASLPAEVVAEAFATTMPEGSALAFAGTAASNGDFFVIAIDAVNDGDLEDLEGQRRDGLIAAFVQQQAEGTLGHVIEELRRRTDIELLPIND